MKLILASASVRRAEILHDAGFSFTVLSSAIDETPYPGESAHDLVQRLAAAKADLVAARAAGPGIVIGADTEVTLENHIFGKPRSSDDARHMLEKLSGRTHAVVTGVALIRIPTPSGSPSSSPRWCTLPRSPPKKSRAIFQPANHMTKQALMASRAAPAATFRASKAAISTSSACPSPPPAGPHHPRLVRRLTR